MSKASIAFFQDSCLTGQSSSKLGHFSLFWPTYCFINNGINCIQFFSGPGLRIVLPRCFLLPYLEMWTLDACWMENHSGPLPAEASPPWQAPMMRTLSCFWDCWSYSYWKYWSCCHHKECLALDLCAPSHRLRSHCHGTWTPGMCCLRNGVLPRQQTPLVLFSSPKETPESCSENFAYIDCTHIIDWVHNYALRNWEI